MEIKILTQDSADEKSRVCRAILDALPEWFGISAAIDSYEKSVREQPFWAAYDGGSPVGFIALAEHNPYTAEIDVMGISPEKHRRGTGRQLVEAAEQYCRERGKQMLLVKTLDFSDSDINYARTRAFYLAMGFIPLQALAGYWDEDNPCLLFGKCLGHKLHISTLKPGCRMADYSGLVKWVEAWDWIVGKTVSERLRSGAFDDRDTAVIITVEGLYAGFCILESRDIYGTDIDPELTPFITAVYVDPKFRGQRVSEKLLGTVCNYARSLGHEAVYLISNEQGYYEKFGFEICNQTVTLAGHTEPVYRKSLL